MAAVVGRQSRFFEEGLPYKRKARLPECAGLYALVWKPSSKRAKRIYDGELLLYVGEARNLRGRWRSHNIRRLLLSTDELWIEYQCLPDISAQKRKNQEQSLIRLENPLLNVAGHKTAKERLIRFLMRILAEAGVVAEELAKELPARRREWRENARYYGPMPEFLRPRRLPKKSFRERSNWPITEAL
jgi:hypothetical protein